MTIPSFEVHLTCNPFDINVAEEIAKKIGKVKVSHLKGDAIMGDDKLMYFTFHSDTYQRASAKMVDLTAEIHLKNQKILRRKIELILFDERTL